jgi:hypothetical protein
MSIQIELVASLAPGATQVPQMQNPDGSSSPFVVPPGEAFVATDISANRISVVATPVLAALNLEQNIGAGGIVARWQFVGEIGQNLERAFSTGIRFATPFSVNLLASSGDSFTVRIHGFFV